MVEIAALVAPIITLIMAIVIGVVFNYIPAKTKKRKPIPLVAFAAALGAVGLILIFLFSSVLSSTVYSIGLFQNFASIFAGVEVSIIKYNAELVAAVVLLAGLGSWVSFWFWRRLWSWKHARKTQSSQNSNRRCNQTR